MSNRFAPTGARLSEARASGSRRAVPSRDGLREPAGIVSDEVAFRAEDRDNRRVVRAHHQGEHVIALIFPVQPASVSVTAVPAATATS
jgi:hypothetical protein